MKLGTINKLIQWTGFVLVVAVDVRWGYVESTEGVDAAFRKVGLRDPTTIKLVFVGWPPKKAWARHCERSRQIGAAR